MCIWNCITRTTRDTWLNRTEVYDELRRFACESILFLLFFCLYWPFIYDTVRTLTVQRIACEISSHHIKYGWIVVAGARWWSVWCRDSGVCAFNHIHVMMNLMRKRSGQMQYLHKYASSDVPISYEDETI